MSDDDFSWDEFFEHFPHGLAVLKNHLIVHAVGYPEPATQTDVDQLIQELREDPKLGLTNLTDYSIMPLSGDHWRSCVMMVYEE